MRYCLAILLCSAGSFGFRSLSAQTVVGFPQRPVPRSTSPASTGMQINPNQRFDTRPAGAAPTVTAAALNPSQIRLTWNPVPGAVGYLVYRNPETSPQILTSTAITATELIDKDLLPNTTASYKVWADFGPQSPNSPGGSGVMKATTPGPVNPTGFTSSSRGGGTVGDIILRWNPAPGAAYYSVKRDGQLVYEGAAPTVTLTGVPVGQYQCTLLAYYGPSGAAVADASTPTRTDATVFSLANLVASATGPGAVTIAWQMVPDAIGYDIQRRKVNATTGAAEASTILAYRFRGSSFTDKDLWNGATYLYDVTADFDPFRPNAPSASVSVTIAP